MREAIVRRTGETASVRRAPLVLCAVFVVGAGRAAVASLACGFATATTSRSRILPVLPVPFRVAKSTPACSARRRARGLAFMLVVVALGAECPARDSTITD